MLPSNFNKCPACGCEHCQCGTSKQKLSVENQELEKETEELRERLREAEKLLEESALIHDKNLVACECDWTPCKPCFTSKKIFDKILEWLSQKKEQGDNG